MLAGYRRFWSERWGTTTYQDYHRRIVKETTTPNGVFGAKFHGAQILEFLRLATGKSRVAYEDRAAVIGSWFPYPRYIWMRRKDAVAQGVSWVKARQSNIWWDADIDPAPPLGAPQPQAVRFDYGAIDRSMYALNDWDGEWRTYFQAAGIEPLVVWYEDLLDDPIGCVRAVLASLGLDGQAENGTSASGFRRQADSSSTQWSARFRRLEIAKRESTLASFAGIHSGETVYVCGGDQPESSIPRDAVTLAVNGSWSPSPASYTVVTERLERAPRSGVVFATGRFGVRHPFLVYCKLHHKDDLQGGPPNSLGVDHEARPQEVAVALARHLGASDVETVGF